MNSKGGGRGDERAERASHQRPEKTSEPKTRRARFHKDGKKRGRVEKVKKTESNVSKGRSTGKWGESLTIKGVPNVS